MEHSQIKALEQAAQLAGVAAHLGEVADVERRAGPHEARAQVLGDLVHERGQRDGLELHLARPRVGEDAVDERAGALGARAEEAEDGGVGRRVRAPLEQGDVVTVEPGVYRKDYGGVRLEDLVVVTGDGCDVLTEYDYDLEIRP